jgi:uncharacterized membrane protein
MSLSRPLLIGLIASAALNVFLIGGVAGVAYVRLSSPPPVAVPPPQPQTVYVPQAAPAPQPADPVETPTRPLRPAAQPPVAPVQPADAERQARPPLWTAGDRLSPESRRALRQALHAANLKNKPITRQARAERQAALDALASPSFDPAEVSRRLTTARTLDVQARGNVEAALAAYAATLSPQERAVLADRIASTCVDALAARALGYRGFAKLARGGTAPEQALMKLFASEVRQRVALVAAELQGADALEVGTVALDGHLAIDEPQGTWLEQYFQSFANTISAGTSEIQRNIIAERVLGLPRG